MSTFLKELSTSEAQFRYCELAEGSGHDISQSSKSRQEGLPNLKCLRINGSGDHNRVRECISDGEDMEFPFSISLGPCAN